eukprot:TRINITY_DN776_c1_g2_i1.p1 TRINITY_DN776_c1_g2~~TRINITY_DN776_c1_g2_i1.p1  ORF type:complete len:190 (-),score=79.25 TRINITY_DN776_c1_g2_i1:34-603(-)
MEIEGPEYYEHLNRGRTPKKASPAKQPSPKKASPTKPNTNPATPLKTLPKLSSPLKVQANVSDSPPKSVEKVVAPQTPVHSLRSQVLKKNAIVAELLPPSPAPVDTNISPKMVAIKTSAPTPTANEKKQPSKVGQMTPRVLGAKEDSNIFQAPATPVEQPQSSNPETPNQETPRRSARISGKGKEVKYK